MNLPTKEGWELRNEFPPSLCKHYLPLFGGGHEMRSTCWCSPTIQNEPSFTVVVHQ